MALIWKDKVAETATTTGTGAFTLAGAITGYRTFASVCSTNDTAYYSITAVDGNGVPTGEWETGLGTYSGTNTLTRTTVLGSSNSDAAVNFSAGTKRVALAYVAGAVLPEASDSDMWAGTSSAKTITPKKIFDAAKFQTLTDGATITPDFGVGLNFKVTLGGNRTLANPSNAKEGQSGVIRVIQDATGSRTLAFGNNWRFPGGAAIGGAISAAASAIDVISYIVGEDGKVYATLSKAFAA